MLKCLIYANQESIIDMGEAQMKIYDGRFDKKIADTTHTVAVVSANKMICTDNDYLTIRKNGRNDWSLFYCESGKMLFDDNKFLKQGQVWIYPPNVPQKYIIYRKDNTVYRYLHFIGSDVFALINGLGISVGQAIDIKDAFLSEIFDKIQYFVSLSDFKAAIHSEYHTLRLLTGLAKVEKNAVCQDMKLVTDKMEHSFASKYNASDYAKMLNVSVDRFNHIFKELLCVSPYSFYMNLRIENAKTLLEETDMKIKDIAEKCGYHDALYFSKAYKKQTGFTPYDFRGKVGKGDFENEA